MSALLFIPGSNLSKTYKYTSSVLHILSELRCSSCKGRVGWSEWEMRADPSVLESSGGHLGTPVEEKLENPDGLSSFRCKQSSSWFFFFMGIILLGIISCWVHSCFGILIHSKTGQFSISKIAFNAQCSKATANVSMQGTLLNFTTQAEILFISVSSPYQHHLHKQPASSPHQYHLHIIIMSTSTTPPHHLHINNASTLSLHPSHFHFNIIFASASLPHHLYSSLISTSVSSTHEHHLHMNAGLPLCVLKHKGLHKYLPTISALSHTFTSWTYKATVMLSPETATNH